MKLKTIYRVLGATGLCLVGSTQAADNYIFELGQIEVNAPKLDLSAVPSESISQEEMLQFNRETVGDALNLLPGVAISNNSRNEQMVSVRSYDARQIPLFVDGIPVYVPYDGYIDLGRFVTSDLSYIQVAKGYSSVSYGPNTLGGAINLVTRKPTKELEGDVRIGYGQENTREARANIGTNQGNWYAQAGVAYRDSDGFRISNNFTSTALENGGRRDNSQYRDDKISLKFGITPNDKDEYALSYYKQNGEKGQPPSTIPTARYWQWPQWDKESLYFISRTGLGEHETVKQRLYVDKFDNEVNSYTNDTYTKLKKSGSGSVGTGRSIYHDKTNGGSAELESTRISNNILRLVTNYKNDRHEEKDANNVTGADFEDTFRSLSVEDAISIGDKTIVSVGFAHHVLTPDKVYKPGSAYALPDKQSANDAQTAISYEINSRVSLHASVAQKTRLPTLKDRYSARLGTFIENPGLKAEEAHNYEIGVEARPWTGAVASATYFLNDMKDKIQQVYAVASPITCVNATKKRCQMQNVGEVRTKGVELSLKTPIGEHWETGANLTLMDIENHNDPSTKITGVPETKVTAHTIWSPINNVKLIGFVEYDGSRWANNTAKLDDFTIVNFKAAWQPRLGLTAEVGVNNLTDKNYSLDYGFPSAGRMWFVNTNYQF